MKTIANTKNTKAIIICGGEGTRMRPLTYKVPKPMILINGKPILEYTILNLKKIGIGDMVMTVGYLREKIIEYFGNGEKWGVNITYLVEKEKQNTAGSILPLKEIILKENRNFIVMMGDQITNIDLNKMMQRHNEKKCIATIALKEKDYKIEYGVAELDGNQITGFVEKPVLKKYINTAIYIFSPRVFNYIKPKEDFAKDVIPKMLKSNEAIYSYFMKNKWIDIGRKSDYDKIINSDEKLKEIREMFE